MSANLNAEFLRTLSKKQRIEAMRSLASQIGVMTDSCPRSFLNGWAVAMSLMDADVSVGELREVSEGLAEFLGLTEQEAGEITLSIINDPELN